MDNHEGWPELVGEALGRAIMFVVNLVVLVLLLPLSIPSLLLIWIGLLSVSFARLLVSFYRWLIVDESIKKQILIKGKPLDEWSLGVERRCSRVEKRAWILWCRIIQLYRVGIQIN